MLAGQFAVFTHDPRAGLRHRMDGHATAEMALRGPWTRAKQSEQKACTEDLPESR